ncbi:5445_t:CDS:2, partial [Racocetra persica]
VEDFEDHSLHKANLDSKKYKLKIAFILTINSNKSHDLTAYG